MKEKEKKQADKCSLCGKTYTAFAFKGGYVCESCLQSIQDEGPPRYPKQ